MAPEKIEREGMVDAPIERVWAVVAEAEHLGTWFGDAGAEIDLRPGGAMTITWTQHGTCHARVERVEPPHVFAYRWARPAHEEVRDGNSTLVEFTLTPEGEQTRLRVVESGFRTLAIPAADAMEQAEGNREGWRIKMDELAAYVGGVPA